MYMKIEMVCSQVVCRNWKKFGILYLELYVALKGLAELPVGRYHVQSVAGTSIAKLNFERQALAIEIA